MNLNLDKILNLQILIQLKFFNSNYEFHLIRKFLLQITNYNKKFKNKIISIF